MSESKRLSYLGDAVAEIDTFYRQHKTQLQREKRAATQLGQLAPEIRKHASKLDKVGWGILTTPNRKGDVEQLLQPLIKRRRDEAKDLFFGVIACSPQDLKNGKKFLRKYVPDNILEPGVHKLPYYVMLVGSPEEIPYDFQYDLSTTCAVGRLHFDDDTSYHKYAKHLDKAEGAHRTNPVAEIFSIDSGDLVGNLLKTHLEEPIHACLREIAASRTTLHVERAATTSKADFEALLGRAPSFLLAAGHGYEPGPGDPDFQRSAQGSLWCDHHESTAPLDEICFRGQDVPQGTQLRGMVAFLFACFGAGTPRLGSFPERRDGARCRQALTLEPFVAALPQALLRHGASAVVSHVDAGWVYTYAKRDEKTWSSQVDTLEAVIRQLFSEKRLGHALAEIQERRKSLAIELLEDCDQPRAYGSMVDEVDCHRRLIRYFNARNLIILGDPAARLAL